MHSCRGGLLLEIKGLEFKRIRLSENATNKCRTFKARTGLTPNIACRLALGISISEPNMPDINLFAHDDSGQEINRYTFLGEHELSLVSLFTQWCHDRKIPADEYYAYLMAHINRGVELLVNRVKSIEELPNLFNSNAGKLSITTVSV